MLVTANKLIPVYMKKDYPKPVIQRRYNIYQNGEKILCLSMSAKIILTGLLILLISCNKFQKKPTMATKPLYKEGFIQTDRIKLHYLDWGGSGQPLVLLHGLGDSPYIFEGFANSLRENFRIIAYSKRGLSNPKQLIRSMTIPHLFQT